MIINSEPENEPSNKDVIREVMEKPYQGITLNLSQRGDPVTLWLEAHKDVGMSIHISPEVKSNGVVLDDDSINRLRKFLVYVDGKKLEDIDLLDVREVLK